LIAPQCLHGLKFIGVPQALQKREPIGLRWSQLKQWSDTIRMTLLTGSEKHGRTAGRARLHNY
jgi:hypothetical protein